MPAFWTRWRGPTEAFAPIRTAMRLNPHYPAPYLFNLGWAYHSTGQYAEAIAALKGAISLNPNYLSSYVGLASSYQRQWLSQQSPDPQTLKEAGTVVQQALTRNSAWHVNHIVMGYIYLDQHQYEQAVAEMEQAVALAPTLAGSYSALAEALSCMGRTKDALEAAAQALRLKPEVADEHFAGVGTAYAVAGHYAEARDPLRRYLSRYPNMLHIHLMLAAVYSELGQTTEAQKEAAEVLRLNPNFSLAVHKQREPIKDPAVLERHIAALRKEGLKKRAVFLRGRWNDLVMYSATCEEFGVRWHGIPVNMRLR